MNMIGKKNNVKATVIIQNGLQKGSVCLLEVDIKFILNVTLTRETQKFMFHIWTFKLQ